MLLACTGAWPRVSWAAEWTLLAMRGCCQLFWAPLAFRAASYENSDTSFLKKPKSAFLNSVVYFLMSIKILNSHYLIVSALKSTHYYITNLFFNFKKYQIHLCFTSRQPISTCMTKLSLILSKFGLLVPFCGGLAARVKMFISVPHGNNRLCSRAFPTFKESLVHILILRRVVCNRGIFTSFSSEPDPQTLILNCNLVPHK